MNDKIQDVYPLAPGQGGILFHSIGGAGSGEYVIQILIGIDGAPDPERERESWRALVARHDALRTAFVWKGRKRPLQVVGRAAAAKLTVTDLSDLDETAQAARLADWLREDRAAGFDLTRAPLLRINRFVLGGGRGRIVVTFHHAALDGWSIPALLRDWAALYAGRALPAAAPFREHVAWVYAQDRDGALAFWREELAGRGPAGDWPFRREEGIGERRGDLSIRLDEAETEALSAALRGDGLTLATAVQGAWALVQARAAGADDLVYGLARAGRPAALPGAESRVGMFLNTLPVRARIEPSRPLADWLRGLQARVLAQGPHEHASLAEIQAADRRGGAPLLQSAVVIENYPTDPALLGAIPGFRVEAVEVLEQTSLPLTLFAVTRGGLRLRLLHDAAMIGAGAARRMLDDLRRVLDAFVLRPETPLADIAILTRAEVAPAAPPAAENPPAAAGAAETLPGLARIWADLLEAPLPAAEANFFDLGGHSRLAITLQDRVARDLGV
ncbi:MAG: condensation domain-containing protein, partial [Pikeienuella sp.]